ncbi:hypothetical protein ACLOJK_023142, partial [Asimina triloba]
CTAGVPKKLPEGALNFVHRWSTPSGALSSSLKEKSSGRQLRAPGGRLTDGEAYLLRLLQMGFHPAIVFFLLHIRRRWANAARGRVSTLLDGIRRADGRTYLWRTATSDRDEWTGQVRAKRTLRRMQPTKAMLRGRRGRLHGFSDDERADGAEGRWRLDGAN